MSARSQFHLPTGPAQVMRGVIGIVVPDLAAVRGRLARVRPRLAPHALRRSPTSDEHDRGDLSVGQSHPPARARPAIRADRAGHRLCRARRAGGSPDGIVRFYRTCWARLPVATRRPRAHARVGAGDTVLMYRETDAAAAYDGNHIQISLADFSGPHRKLLERGLVTEESDQHQYRFQAVIDPRTTRSWSRWSTKYAACATRCMHVRWSTATLPRPTCTMPGAATPCRGPRRWNEESGGPYAGRR